MGKSSFLQAFLALLAKQGIAEITAYLAKHTPKGKLKANSLQVFF
jgi:hypothetical protein